MSKTFRAWDVDQVWLLPPSVHDVVPAGHPAHLVRELVRHELDLSDDRSLLTMGSAGAEKSQGRGDAEREEFDEFAGLIETCGTDLGAGLKVLLGGGPWRRRHSRTSRWTSSSTGSRKRCSTGQNRGARRR
jgi:hypothetical protein